MMQLPTESRGTVLIERAFDFPREVVFEAWTKPELLVRWFAPRGCSIYFARIDVRPGGGFHSCVRNAQFGDCWTLAIYTEIVHPERLAFSWRIADANGCPVSPQSQGHDPDWPEETRVSVTFVERGAGTLLTLRQNVSEAVARRTGAHPSWIQMFELLGGALNAPSSEPTR